MADGPSALRIPPRYQAGLRSLAELEDDEFGALESALSQWPSRLTTARLVEHVESVVPGVDADDLIETVLSLFPIISESSEGLDELAVEISRSPDLDLSGAMRDTLASRLVALLQAEPLAVAARAHDVVAEHERAYHGARVLTDLRPVFGARIADGPKALAIVASMKIEFHPAGSPDIEAVYFAMDESDLEHLRDQINRAIDKTNSLKSLASRIDLPYWEFRESNATSS